MIKSLTLNPYMSLFNLKLCTHIWSTNINFRPPYIGLFGPSWSELIFHPMGELQGGLGLGHVFCHGQKYDYLSHEARLKNSVNVFPHVFVCAKMW